MVRTRSNPGFEGENVRSGSDEPKKPPKRGGDQNHTDKSVGETLRRVYDDAVDEAIPDEMLDLLRKLG